MLISVLTFSGLVGSAGCGCALGWWLRSARSWPGYPGRGQAPEASCDPGLTCPDAIRDAERVKAALERLRRESRLRAHRPSAAAAPGDDLRCVLSEVLTEIAGSPRAREAEAGRVLLDYYIKRVGSHEVVMERLYLSRPTFYRRLKYGLNLVAQRLDERAVP